MKTTFNKTRMQRTIKFRAWHKGSKQMVKDLSVLRDEDYIYMQFTGLKDKNGKEIYEGDIVKAKYDFEEKEEIGFVEWINGGLKIRWKISEFIDSTSDINNLDELEEHKKKVSEFEDSLEVFEVIGNLYENPELLKESKITPNVERIKTEMKRIRILQKFLLKCGDFKPLLTPTQYSVYTRHLNEIIEELTNNHGKNKDDEVNDVGGSK